VKRRFYRIRLFFEGLTIGIFTGAIVAVLRFVIDAADIFRPQWFQNLTAEKIILTLIILIGVAIFLARIIAFDKQVAGSGVPQIKGMLQGVSTMQKPLRLIFIKFAAVIFGIGAGLSLGRAGIAVQFGACVGNFFSKKSHVEGDILLTAGAGAGLAAVFNAPLAGVIFCIEELHKKFSPEVLVATLTASVTASAVVELIFGVRPIFETITAQPLTVPEILKVPTLGMFAELSAAPLKIFLCFVLLGIFLGILGAIFTKTLLFSLEVYDRLKIFGMKRFLVPLILILPLGATLPQILGCGNVLVDELLSTGFNSSLVVILFLGKWLFTMISFGTGAAGGVFLPLLTVGALGGKIFADIGAGLGFFSAQWATLLTVFGMVAFFAAVVKAPITGSILIMEITGQFSYLLTLTIVSGAAYMAADFCGGKPIFSALLNRSLSKT